MKLKQVSSLSSLSKTKEMSNPSSRNGLLSKRISLNSNISLLITPIFSSISKDTSENIISETKRIILNIFIKIYFFKKNISTFGDRDKNNDLRCVYPSFCSFIDAPTGFVYPCDCSIHRDRTIYKIGELKENSMGEIWNGEKRKVLKKGCMKELPILKIISRPKRNL